MERDLICTVEFGDEKFQADVHLQQLENSNVIAEVVPNKLVTTLSTECFLEAAPSEQPLKLKRTHGFLRSIVHPVEENGRHTEMKVRLDRAEFEYSPRPTDDETVTVRLYLTNLPYFQMEKEYTVTVSGQRITFFPHREGAISNVATVRNLPYLSIKTISEIIESVCWLTSFACGRLSGIARIEALRGEDLVYLDLRSIMTEFKRNFEVIYSDFDSASIIKFLENSFNLYERLRDTYLLNNLIHIGVVAKSTPYMENKTLLMVNFLEVLRYNYAVNVGVPRGLIKQKGTEFKWQTGPNHGNKASFKEILEQFCQDNTITGWNDDFKDLRNEVVHTGKGKGADASKRYYDLHHFCDRVILALLEWEKAVGSYIPVNNPSFNGPNKWGMNIVKFVR